MFSLFLSHTAHHKQAVAEVKNHLQGYAVDGFVAHEDIEPMSEWVGEIEAALRRCDALAAFLTPEFPGSKWTDQETGFCFARGLLIVPIRLGVDPYGFIGRYQAINGSNKSTLQLASEIFGILIESPLTKDAMARALVKQFERTPSYNMARWNAHLLDRVPVSAWNDQLLAAVEKAAQENGEIGDAWIGDQTGPAWVAGLVSRIRPQLIPF
jgi:hypothetical protein